MIKKLRGSFLTWAQKPESELAPVDLFNVSPETRKRTSSGGYKQFGEWNSQGSDCFSWSPWNWKVTMYPSLEMRKRGSLGNCLYPSLVLAKGHLLKLSIRKIWSKNLRKEKASIQLCLTIWMEAFLGTSVSFWLFYSININTRPFDLIWYTPVPSTSVSSSFKRKTLSQGLHRDRVVKSG